MLTASLKPPPPMRPWIQDAAMHAETARLAFELWRRQGRPAGREVEFWMEAERQVAEAQRRAVAARPGAA